MSIQQFRYFLNLAKVLNFTDAARMSNISQPTLTKAIRRLEEEYGGLLIYRDGKDSRLTELGRSLAVEFEYIIAAEERAVALAQSILKDGRSIVNIGISSTIGPHRFVGFFKEVISRYPNYRFILHRVRPSDAPDMVLSGALDLCFCSDHQKESSKLLVVDLYAEELQVACGRDHKFAKQESIALEQLDGERFLDRSNCEFRTQFYETIATRDITIVPCIESDAEDWLQSFVASGVGICLLPQFSPVTEEVVLRPVENLSLSRTVQFVCIYGSPTSKSVMNMREVAENFSWDQQS